MKKIIITIITIITLSLLIIPFFLFNEDTKKNKIIKKENNTLVESDKTSKEEKEKFIYITSNYDNINEYIKEEVKEEEKVIYVCINE
ncbi:MAG: hypothetical protein IKF37_00775 [Bacilli bacterium]|nr:hypothetical protein [Bacilli bacterium]